LNGAHQLLLCADDVNVLDKSMCWKEKHKSLLVTSKKTLEKLSICSSLVCRMQDKISTDIANKCFGGVTKFIFRTP